MKRTQLSSLQSCAQTIAFSLFLRCAAVLKDEQIQHAENTDVYPQLKARILWVTPIYILLSVGVA